MKNLEGLKALVVDDDATTRSIIRINLAHIGIDSILAGNGLEAIEALRNNRFDFIMMDINMPRQDGLDATRWIREVQGADKDIPIFALTSYGSEDHTREILQAGLNEHLVKPFNMHSLLPILEKYFWNRTAADRLKNSFIRKAG